MCSTFRLAVALLTLSAISIGALSAAANEPKKADEVGKLATIKVFVPQETTQLKVDGAMTKSTGLERVFQTTPLSEGKTYRLTFEVELELQNSTKITRVREVDFKAGEEVMVDLRNAEQDAKIATKVDPNRDEPKKKDVVTTGFEEPKKSAPAPTYVSLSGAHGKGKIGEWDVTFEFRANGDFEINGEFFGTGKWTQKENVALFETTRAIFEGRIDGKTVSGIRKVKDKSEADTKWHLELELGKEKANTLGSPAK